MESATDLEAGMVDDLTLGLSKEELALLNELVELGHGPGLEVGRQGKVGPGLGQVRRRLVVVHGFFLPVLSTVSEVRGDIVSPVLLGWEMMEPKGTITIHFAFLFFLLPFSPGPKSDLILAR